MDKIKLSESNRWCVTGQVGDPTGQVRDRTRRICRGDHSPDKTESAGNEKTEHIQPKPVRL